MMAARWSDSPKDTEERKHSAVAPACQAKQKDGRDQSETSAAVTPGADEEPFSWPGPKTLRLRRTSQGFGFTLRHFIVYPPESAVHNSLKDDENGSRGRQKNRLEPMDTIFVKQVKEGGPAHGAGLCTGDRLVKVNGESIIGKTYSQVIALIQNSDASLELCVMPKDEDILQLAYSQDAYLKGNEAYSGNAQNIPEPPPIFYPRIELKAAAMAQPPDPGPARRPAPVDNISGDGTGTPADPADRGSRLARAGPGHRTEENRYGPPADRPRPLAAGCPPYPETFSPLVRAPLAAASTDTFSTATSPTANHCSPSPPPPAPPTHQNIDWRTYTTYKDYIDAKRLHTYGCRTIQERLDSLRAAAANSAYAPKAGAASQVRRKSASNERGADPTAPPPPPPLRSASQERLGGPPDGTSRRWPRSASQDALPFPGAGRVAKPRARSCDHISHKMEDKQETSRRSLAPPKPEQRLSNSPDVTKGSTDSALAVRADGLIMRPSRLPVKNSLCDLSPASSAIKTTAPLRDQRANAVGNHLGFSPLTLQLRGRAGSLKTESRSESGLAARSSSCSGAASRPPALRPMKSEVLTITVAKETPERANGGLSEGGEGPDATVVVVLRRDRTAGGARPPSYADRQREVRSPPLVKAGSAGSAAMCWASNETPLRRLGDTSHKSGRSNRNDSLDSIPFIDEPSSPSTDQDSTHIPASGVISTPLITTIPPSPTSSSPLIRRHLSHDQDSLHLSVIGSDSGTKSERSKSYDEGIDNYHEESRGRSLLPGLKGLRKAVDRSSEDSGSRRDSLSDVFCDATKEGLLHLKQLHADKGKRVGGGNRQWKQMYAVLRGHYLCLYKDKKEGQAHASCQTIEEPLQISIKACLIDISYSDTKRKNVLRLTTSDCEYLFQAEDREDMLAWIRVIQDSSNLDEENAAFTSHDLISRRIKEYNTLMSPTGSKTEPSPRASRQSLSIRQTLLGGKGETKATSPNSPKPEQERKGIHKDDTSPPKDKGTWRKGIPGLMRKPFEKKPSPGVTFGVRLDDCPPAQTNKFVPLIVEVCCKLVEERGLEYTGIYRVPGNNAAISNMQEELNNKGMGDIDIQDDKWRDLNVISSLLKSFFRKLPEPLFTNDGYAGFIDANRIEDPVERLKVLKRLLRELPDHHYETLKFLSAHLKTVAENSEKNKMEPRNLAIVFGPTLVRTTDDNMTHMVTHMPDQYKIVETLIQNYDWFFTDDGNGEPVTVSHEESAIESQPVPNIDHLLTNIGRTGASQGDVSDSPTSDSAKSKGSWGSGKDQCSRDLLVSSIFAAASRKRGRSREKRQPSSSDDDLEAVFSRKEVPSGQRPNLHPLQGDRPRAEERKENGRNSSLQKEKTPPSPVIDDRSAAQRKTSLSDPLTQLEEITSDLGTVSSGASVPRSRPKKWSGGAFLDPPASAGAEVSSIASDHSTTSSVTFPAGALSPEPQGGEEADDERSELVSEGRPMETDSEGEFPVFASGGGGGGGGQSTPRPKQEKPDAAAQRREARRLFPTQRMTECDTLSRRWSLRHKTDSDSSAEGAAGTEGRAESSGRLSRVLEVMKKGRSSSSISSSSRSESERPEPAWHLKITERLRFRIRSSADDDMLATKSQTADARSSKKKNIRRRHTMGGQRDFAVINDWREQGGVDQTADLSALDRPKPRRSAQDLSFRDWITQERLRGSEPRADTAPKAEPEDDHPEAPDKPPPPATAEQVNGGPDKTSDRHPLKPSGAQVTRSRFYQYL